MAFRSHFFEYWQDLHTHVLLLPDHPYLRLLQSSNTFLDTHMAFRKSPSERTTRLVDTSFSLPVASSFCEDQLLFTTFKAILESNFHDYQHYPCNSLFPKAVQIQEMWVGSENKLLLCAYSGSVGVWRLSRHFRASVVSLVKRKRAQADYACTQTLF